MIHSTLHNDPARRRGVPLTIGLLLPLLTAYSAHAGTFGLPAGPIERGVPLVVVAYDKATISPLELAHVSLYRRSKFIVGVVTSQAGRATFRDVAPGAYRITVHSVGYVDRVDSMIVDSLHAIDSIGLTEIGSMEIVVQGERQPTISAVDMPTGNQVFEAETYHAPPTARMTELVQQNVTGAVRAPTGEVHIRGQHGELTYYVDGMPVPLGVFGGLNEVVDPKVIERATFLTGGFPAEFGGQMAAVVDVQNRVPTGRFHLDASTYSATYALAGGGDSLVQPKRLVNANGQQVSISDHVGSLGFFLSGSRQETDRRIDPPVPTIFHDHGFDYFAYGKADYVLSDQDYLTMNLNYGVTSTQVPFDSLGAGPLDDAQRTVNAFQTLTYYRTLSTESEHERSLMVGGYLREGSLAFRPGPVDRPAFFFAGDTVNAYVIGEQRAFTSAGMRGKYEARLSHKLKFAMGLNASATSGTEDFNSRNAAGAAGPGTTSGFSGSDVGLFIQEESHPYEWFTYEVGLRFDVHNAPAVRSESQLSPRFRWNFLLGEADNAYLYYGRLFMPVNVEGIRSLGHSADGAGAGTLTERDNFYEAVFTHSLDNGVRTKTALFYKVATPGLDDQTIGSSAIKTPVNIARVTTSGIELGFTYASASAPISAALSAALIHTYGSGAISGGFLAFTDAGSASDLDHDQRLSVVGSVNYQPSDWFANLTGIYGSGLSNGNPGGEPFGTSLVAFNQFAHVTPSWIFNLSAGYSIPLGGTSNLEASLYFKNVLDHQHLIKGAYFSGASWEEPRNVMIKLSLHV